MIMSKKSIRFLLTESLPLRFDPSLAGRAIVDGLEYLTKRLDWSARKIANTVHLPANTINNWLTKDEVSISNARLHPDIQGILHLLAIHRSLEGMFNDPIHQRAWLSSRHPELKIIPEERMSESLEGLIFIRQYLDCVRGKGG